MRTRTTTREQTWNIQHNYPLKMFCWNLSKIAPIFIDIYDTVKTLESRCAIDKGQEVTDDIHAMYIIDAFLSKKN